MSRVSIVTLGCPKNAVDSESIGGILRGAGHDLVERPGDADVIMVNTCGFIDPARRETVDEVLDLADLKSSGRARGLIMTGCLVARSADDLADSLPEVDAFVDFAAYPRIAEIVAGVHDGSLEDRIHGSPGTRFDPAWWDAAMVAAPRMRFGRAPWTYLKIAEGCDRGCTFCAIPLMRGKLRSRSADSICSEARSLARAGVSELSLVSQDSVMWGRDTGEGDLSLLLERLEDVDEIRRIRLMYLHPQGVTRDLIERMIRSDKVVNYFDLSLQHVSPAILRAMGRWGSAERFTAMIAAVRDLDPLAAIRTTFIVGFPGESEADVGALDDFIADSDADWVGVFTYSREAGTRSFDLEGHMPEVIKRERHERIATTADAVMERRAARLVGAHLEILVERFDPAAGVWIGRSHREAPEIDGEITIASDHDLTVGTYVRALVTAQDGADLVAKLEA